MTPESIQALMREQIRSRVHRLQQAGKQLRPDSAAWLLVAFRDAADMKETRELADARLCEVQRPDGRVLIAPQFSQAAWPTPLAVLGWSGMEERQEQRERAVEFLLAWKGLTFPNEPQVLGHDTTIAGWPWISGTHSWIEPTALALLALRQVGRSDANRCVEARRLILNRQLPGGGWNFGNTTVFGRELRPMIHCTGIALTAAAFEIPESEVGKSLDYVQEALANVRSPLSLGWGLIALTAWDREVARAEWIGECLGREAEIGDYDISLLCLVYCALLERERNPLLRVQV